jgi:stearoyl-CoA desaturase (delta-9 desaturase)
MRFWLWLTTGMRTKDWVAIHRKHHRFCEEQGDPHSPLVFGIWHVLLAGAFLYNTASKDRYMVEQYGVGTPNDWVERRIYNESWLGIILMLIINVMLFGLWGILIWGIQMIWIPLHAAGIINGIGHWWGYRNGNTKDNSRNIVPWGIWIGGEELHNNHHLDPGSVKFSRMKWEFDLGYLWLRFFSLIGLAKINRPNTV